jgi:predicted GNAT family acetyltransferase
LRCGNEIFQSPGCIGSIAAGNAAGDNPALRRFEMLLGDGALAVAYYKVEDDRVVLVHTEVPQELSGQGAGAWRFRSAAT